MVLALGRFKVSIAALAVLTAAFVIDAPLLVWALAAAAAHEAGHMLAFVLCRQRITELRLEPWGFEMSCGGTLSYAGEIITAAAGPAASVLLAVLLSLAGRTFNLPGLYFASGVSFVFGLFNALPVWPLDGGRVLLNALALPFGPFAAERALCVTSCIVIFALLITGAIVLFKTRVNFTLLLAAVWLFISYCKRSGINVELRKTKTKIRS